MIPDAFLRAPIAHRAYHDINAGRPENGPAAIRAAIAAGYGIEIDVQLSADGVAMVFHDDALERMTAARGQVRDHSADALGEIALKGSDEGIPTLSEVLALVAGRVALLVEIKDQSRVMGPVDGRLERAVAKLLDDYDGPVAVMSFNPHSVAALAVEAPGIARGLTSCAFTSQAARALPDERRAQLAAIADFNRVGASFISHDWRDLARPRVAELKAEGVPVLCWTVRSPKIEAEARKLADNITFEGYAAPVVA